MKRKIKGIFKFALLIALLSTALCFQSNAMSRTAKQEIKSVKNEIVEKYTRKNRKVKFYKTKNLTLKRLWNRKSTEIIVERSTGTVINPKTGDGKAAGYYINYKYVPGIRKGSKIVSFFVYNPKTRYTDDIIERYDIVVKR